MNVNSNSTPIKRLLSEFRALKHQPEPEFVAGPIGDDLFIWHFTIKGPRDTPFEGGIYHGKIVFPQQYPMKPPDIYFLTPNGRFETRKKICLTVTSFHPDSWNPAWDVRTVLTSIIAFLPTKTEGAVGGVEASDAERRKLALQSRNYKCSECDLFIDPDTIGEKPSSGESEQEEPQTEEKPNEEEDKIDKPLEQKLNNEEEELNEEEKEKDIDNNENQAEDAAGEKLENEVVVDDEGRPHYNYEELKHRQNDKSTGFIPLLDIPIIILFVLLILLIINSTFSFINFSI